MERKEMIAGAGFARMAWKLAQSRTYNCDQHDWVSEKWKLPFPREEHCGMPDIEYYRIIDKAASLFDVHPVLRDEVIHL